jgi:integrase
MAKKLTTKSIENMKPAAARREISDGGSGLYLIVQSSGHRSWALRYRANGRPTKLTLGRWPEISLAGARKLAADALHERERGNDPVAAKQTAKIAAMEAATNTVASVCATYLHREGGKLRTADQRERIFRRLVYPAIGERPIDSIKRSDLVAMLDRIEDERGARTADVVLATVRRAFTWYALRTDSFNNPIIRGMARQNTAEHRRTRTLDDDELRRLWAATADGQPFSNLIRFLLLTTARRGEAAGMRWDEVDATGVWTLPASRSKTKIEVVRPLSRAAQAVLAAQPRSDLPWVFTTTGTGPFTSFSEPKARLDAASGVSGYTIHDLRRSARSLLSRAGVSVDIAERCLGHAMPVIRATYDRHRYLEEMAQAFEALAALLERIVSGADAAVVQFRR